MIKVLVADDHAVVRRGVREILEEVPDMVVAGEAGTGHEALQAAWENDYDVVVLDIGLPDISGLEVLKQLRVSKPELRVLILSMYSEEQFAVRTLKAGAAGYLTKVSAPEELVAAIRTVWRGENYVTQSLAEELVARLRDKAEVEPHETLSDREYQVMCLLANGNTVTEIAAELSLGVTTVSTYRARLLNKLGLKSTAEIIRYALERGLAE